MMETVARNDTIRSNKVKDIVNRYKNDGRYRGAFATQNRKSKDNYNMKNEHLSERTNARISRRYNRTNENIRLSIGPRRKHKHQQMVATLLDTIRGALDQKFHRTRAADPWRKTKRPKPSDQRLATATAAAEFMNFEWGNF